MANFISKDFVLALNIDVIYEKLYSVFEIIVVDRYIITVKVEGRNERFLISLDSRSETIDQSVKLKIRKQDFHVNLLRLNNQNFPSTLRNKLMWGLDKRN